MLRDADGRADTTPTVPQSWLEPALCCRLDARIGAEIDMTRRHVLAQLS